MRSPGVWRRTGEPVFLRYAGWTRQVLALLLDLALVAPVYLLMALFSVTSGLPTERDPVNVGDVAAVLLLVWNLVLRQGRTGSSLGKQAVGIRVLDERNLEPPGPWHVFVRLLAHVADLLPFGIGFLWPVWDGRKQTFADKLTRTVVVRERLHPHP